MTDKINDDKQGPKHGLQNTINAQKPAFDYTFNYNAVPPQAPRKGNRFSLWLGRSLLRLMGWRLQGQLPNYPKLILAALPHTSNWDFILAMLTVLATGVRLSYLMKKEAFFWPVGGLFKWLGGVPIERSKTRGIVEDLAAWLNQQEQAWIAITPEGTRQKVDKLKTGFIRLAWETNTPVMLIAWDYPSKSLVFEKVWNLTGDFDADCEAITQYINNRYQGRNLDWQ